MLYAFLSVVVLLGSGMYAWSEEPPAQVAAVVVLTEGVAYQVAQINNRQLSGEAAPTLTLDQAAGRVSGFSGVNRYGGEYTLTGNQLICGRMMSTQMAGDETATAIEQDFLSILSTTLTVTATVAGVELRSTTGSIRLLPKVQ